LDILEEKGLDCEFARLYPIKMHGRLVRMQVATAVCRSQFFDGVLPYAAKPYQNIATGGCKTDSLHLPAAFNILMNKHGGELWRKSRNGGITNETAQCPGGTGQCRYQLAEKADDR
jgi:hypothetical protein